MNVKCGEFFVKLKVIAYGLTDSDDDTPGSGSSQTAGKQNRAPLQHCHVADDAVRRDERANHVDEEIFHQLGRRQL
jgi:hypothetical protein